MKVAIAITGASGQIYAYKFLRLFEEKIITGWYVSVTASETAFKVMHLEGVPWKYVEYIEKAKPQIVRYDYKNFEAPIASGSYGLDCLVVIPCTVGALGRIASGVCDDLITRAAHVQLKERRRLVLVVRETPLNLVDIKNMETITLAGGIIMPASPGLYLFKNSDITFEKVAERFVERVWDVAGLPDIGQKRWGENNSQ
jgi:4-hydroxy-3-polyprenylbenzoate decarboxylase